MTLYEEYENGLDLVVYIENAYNNLKKAVYITAEVESIYDERDIEVLWDYLINTGNIECITKEKGVKDLIRVSFNMFGNYIDSRLLAMVRDYESMDISEFLSIYLEKEEKKEEDRTIKSIISNDFEFLDCASTIGPRRKNNEDFVCCIQSPINEKIKLLLVCDGMGGFNHGEAASKIVAEEIINWFNSYGFVSGFDGIELEINKVIEKARLIIRKSYVMCGTTLTFAIVGVNETFIGNVGDSRTYIIKDGVLNQITKDDSEVWKEFYDKKLLEKDDLRFLRRNNVLINAIDDYLRPIDLQAYFILNSAYDGILLLSDGVTDILSDKVITRILNETVDSDILDKLLYESCYGNPDFPTVDFDDILYPTLPGKDNASGAVYIKRKK